MKSAFSELPEHDARQTQEGLHPDVQAAYDYVSRVANTADIPHPFPAWHGWALREAFLAGCSHHSRTTSPAPISLNERTGRTTRMLNEAFRLAKEGRAVYVLAADSRHLYTLERMSDQLFGNGEASSLGIKFEVAHNLSNFDFATMTLRGAHPKCVVLVDHYTIECTYAKMLTELHRFNEPLSMHLVE